MQKSGLAAALAISVMMLPIIIRASDVVLRLVPGNLREASYALGSTRWKTVWSVVLPTSRSGLVTAVILGTARGIGETSPVLLTSGMTNNMNYDPSQNPMISLPLQVFTFIKSPEPNFVARGFGTAAVLMFLVLILFMLARLIGGKGAGVLSARQRQRAMHRSQLDLYRISTREKDSTKGKKSKSSTPKSE
jgi:phosphate transport system permease protein